MLINHTITIIVGMEYVPAYLFFFLDTQLTYIDIL